MLVSQLTSISGYPLAREFFQQVLDMQFSDVRAMLHLPRPDVGIMPGCNFAIGATLCNLISGVSTTLYKPASLLHEAESACGSGRAFQSLVRDFFPYAPPVAGGIDFAHDLYQLCRNPLAHSVGLRNATAPTVTFTRIFSASHDRDGWRSDELDNLERRGESHGLHPGIAVHGNQWTLHCDSFYLDVINLLRRLTSDSSQMSAAEHRFGLGIYNWRH